MSEHCAALVGAQEGLPAWESSHFLGLMGFTVLISPAWPLRSGGEQNLAKRTLGHSLGRDLGQAGHRRSSCLCLWCPLACL